MNAYRVTTPGPGFIVEAPFIELVADWADQYLPCPPTAHRARRRKDGVLVTLVIRDGQALTGARIVPLDNAAARRGPRARLEQCPVILGHEDDGGQHQCAKLAGHPGDHDARRNRT